MYTPESVLRKEIRKILWDFETETNHLIQTRWPDQVVINKQQKKKKKKKKTPKEFTV